MSSIYFSHFHNYSLPADVRGLGGKGDGIIFQSLLESTMIPYGEYLIWLEIDPAAPGQKLFDLINSSTGYRIGNFRDVFRFVPDLDIELQEA